MRENCKEQRAMEIHSSQPWWEQTAPYDDDLFASLGIRDINDKCTYEFPIKSSPLYLKVNFSEAKFVGSYLSTAAPSQSCTTMRDVKN